MKSIGVVLLALIPLITSAGERHAVHLTGNPSADFFAVPLHSQPALADSNPPDWRGSEPVTGGEKSPWLAGALSLAVPGAGQVYTKSYIEAAVSFAIEAASWAVAYHYNKKGDQQTSDYHAYADQHWSAVRYANWTLDHLGQLGVSGTAYPMRDQYALEIYPDGEVTPEECGAPFSCVHWEGLNRMERDIAGARFNGYTHTLPYYGEQQYFELIGKYDEFSRGWDDSDPEGPLDPNNPSSDIIRSNSKRFYEYADMRAQSNYSYDVASTFVSVAVINHLVSAIDAFWSATRFNSALHADINMRVQPTMFGVIPVTEARLRYDF